MTFEDRAHDAAQQLGEWTPAVTTSAVAVGRHRRRRRRRQGALGAAAVVLIATSAVVLWPNDRDQRVIAAGPTTSVEGRWCERWIGADLIVFMNPDAVQSELDSIGALLDADDRVASSRYLDDASTFRLYQQIFRDEHPEVLGALELGELPTSYRVTLSDVTSGPAIVAELRAQPGVYVTELSGSGPQRLDLDGRIPCPPIESSTAADSTLPTTTSTGPS